MQGNVKELWRYPVKSMLGEQCQALELESRGVVGDRTYAIRDINGKFGSGKSTRRFKRIDGLFRFQVQLTHDRIPSIRFPSGTTIRGDHPEIDQMLSDELGQPVTLAVEGAVSHMDAGAVHIITDGSLKGLENVAPEGTADARRFRPNIVLSTLGARPEQEILGKRIRVGSVELQVTGETERCVMVSLPQAELKPAASLLDHIAQHWNLAAGVYAAVTVPGVVGIGDKIEVLPA